MTTLGTMKTRIGSEMVRPDLLENGAVESEIRSAIKHYRSRRFWFNERNSRVTFPTVAGQFLYDGTDQADIPNLIRIDSIIINRGTEIIPMRKMDQGRMTLLLGGPGNTSNLPSNWSYYEQVLRIYPVPDGAYTIQIAGVVRVAAPVDDDATGNAWMDDAEEMIRARAKRNLYANWMLDPQMAQTMAVLEQEAFDNLTRETSSRSQVRSIRPHTI